MTSRRKRPLRAEIVTYDKPTGYVNIFNYLDCTISVLENNNLERKLSKIKHVRETIRTVLYKKRRKNHRLNLIKLRLSQH
jgi:hypothetical protein